MADEPIQVGKWAVAYDRKNEATMFRFDFLDRGPLIFQFPKDEAQAFAKAILAQHQNPPPSRLS